MQKDLPTLIHETKEAVFKVSGIQPDIIDLPITLYYQLLFTLKELYGFEELDLDYWDGLKINLLWKSSSKFLVRKRAEEELE